MNLANKYRPSTLEDVTQAFETVSSLGVVVELRWSVKWSGKYSALITEDTVNRMTPEKYLDECIPHVHGMQECQKMKHEAMFTGKNYIDVHMIPLEESKQLKMIEDTAIAYECGKMLQSDSEVEIAVIDNNIWLCDYSESIGGDVPIEKLCCVGYFDLEKLLGLCDAHGWRCDLV